MIVDIFFWLTKSICNSEETILYECLVDEDSLISTTMLHCHIKR